MKWIKLLCPWSKKGSLEYIIRDIIDPVNIDEDPLPVGAGSPPYATRYDSFHDEMITHTSHAHPGFKANNKRVFNLFTRCK